MMKKSLILALAVVALAGFATPGVAQQNGTNKKPPTGETTKPTTGENVDKPSATSQVATDLKVYSKKLVAEAIASSVVVRKGKEFPLVARGSSADAALTGGASCELGDTQIFTQNAGIDLESPDHVKKTNTYPSTPPERKIVSPPNADWVIQSYHRVITSAGPPYEAGDSAFPAGYTFLASGSYSSVKSTMHSFVGSLNIPGYVQVDLAAKLDTLISNISSYSYSLSGSHGTVEHTALVRGTGVFNPNVGHSWYHGYIDGSLVCAPAYLHDQNALTTRLKVWVKDVLQKLPHRIEDKKTT
jgi:hypothetical protein